MSDRRASAGTPRAGRRRALLVAVDRYQNPGLSSLRAPASDARALAAVLADPALGDFTVDVLENPTSSGAAERVDDFLADCASADLALLHFSCHGMKDPAGELFLAATNTVPGRLSSTSVEAAWVGRQIRRCRARSVVLLLDCCFGGAFERGMLARAGGDVDVGEQFPMGRLDHGRGRTIITASTSVQYAYEADRDAIVGTAASSVFTGALVEGIRSGAADRDGDGRISIGELYDYVYDQVQSRTADQTPSKWEFGLQGGVYIARSPVGRPEPETLRSDRTEAGEGKRAEAAPGESAGTEPHVVVREEAPPIERPARTPRRLATLLAAPAGVLVIVLAVAAVQLYGRHAADRKGLGPSASPSPDPSFAAANEFLRRVPEAVRKLGCEPSVSLPPNPLPYVGCGSVNGVAVRYYLHASKTSMDRQFAANGPGSAKNGHCATPAVAIEDYHRGTHHGRLGCEDFNLTFTWTDESNLTFGQLTKYDGEKRDYPTLYELWGSAVDVPGR